MTLRELKEGESACVLTVGGSGALRQHFLDMGIIPGTDVTIVKFAPMGDPVEICLHGYELTLRLDDADKINVEPIAEKISKNEYRQAPISEHLGLGEDGKYHPKGSGDPLPDGTLLTFALVGNQNSGKTTLF
ncbi:MAG: FeoA domain-containing protein, partial [Clostridia bacterium]|nr:FeoA domain-containing protein [Clostridia bacterium]